MGGVSLGTDEDVERVEAAEENGGSTSWEAGKAEGSAGDKSRNGSEAAAEAGPGGEEVIEDEVCMPPFCEP